MASFERPWTMYVMGLTESGREIDRLMARDGMGGIKKRLGGKGESFTPL